MNVSVIESLLIAASSIDAILIPIVACAAAGFAVYVVVRTVINTLDIGGPEQDDQWRYDVSRINELRRISPLYRFFGPLIHGLAPVNHRLFRDQLPEIEREVQAGGLPRFWTGAEYLARIELLTLLAAPIYLYVCVDTIGAPGILIALAATILTCYLLRRRLASRAHSRLLMIKRRLPFLLDLLTLLMEAGSTFMQALSEVAEEYREHPVGVEFGRVLAEINMGRGRTTALESLRERLSDDEITSIVGSIIQGEELGTPLALLFRTQADVLRIKRTQRAETIAGEAGVKMLLPTVLVMAATVIIILGPFLLGFIYEDFIS